MSDETSKTNGSVEIYLPKRIHSIVLLNVYSKESNI